MLSILLIGVALSMDALAVSVTSGMTVRNFGKREAAILGLYFGGFQALMPFLGCILGSTVSGLISRWGPYVSFALLVFIGVKMIIEALHPDGEQGCAELSHKRLAVMAIATSLDALAVGVSFAFMPDVRLIPACLLIGAVTFVICFTGGIAGSKIPGLDCRRAGVLGGAVLIAIGVKLLLEGLGVL